MILPLAKLYVEHIIKKKRFVFNGFSLPLFFHSYNNFGLSERSVEIPIVKNYLLLYSPENVLEIGNVSNHYYDEFKNCFIKKDTVDKYERSYDVINMDIRDFKPDEKYDFIFSISTFEHMDSDGGRNTDYDMISHQFVCPYSSIAFSNMEYVITNMLKEKGRMVVTFPLGYLNDEIGCSLKNSEETNLPVDFLTVHNIQWKEKNIVVLEMQK